MQDFYLFYSLWMFAMVMGLGGVVFYWLKRRARLKAEKEAAEAKRKSVKTKLMNYHKVK